MFVALYAMRLTVNAIAGHLVFVDGYMKKELHAIILFTVKIKIKH
jgi:hypothetical protein